MSSTKQGNFFLIDCNSFYASCERVFAPRLASKAVVVLSNNDGCVIARSKEAKALGIPMGAPAYQYAPLFKAKRVEVFSSNFTLYGDMSHRVMQVLSQFSPNMEEYSIDEAFLFIDAKHPEKIGREIKERVFRWTGIPVSVGIAKTKTLAKVANHCAKKQDSGVVFIEESPDVFLKSLPVEKVWGIGSRIAKRLASFGLYTAAQFCSKEPEWIRRQFSVTLEKTALELKGLSCLKLEEVQEPKKSITCSRSFRVAIETLPELSAILATFVARAARKLRRNKSRAGFMTILLMTSPFVVRPYSRSVAIQLKEPSSYTPTLIKAAKYCLKKLFQAGYPYKKVGVIFTDLTAESSVQNDLFGLSIHEEEKQRRGMRVADRLWARGLRFAAEGAVPTQQNNLSPYSTTDWNRLPLIKMRSQTTLFSREGPAR